MPSIGPISATPDQVNTFVGPVDPMVANVAAAVAASNDAHLMIFQVKRPVTVSEVFFQVGVQSGNVDIGIFAGGKNGDSVARLASTGSTACPAGGSASLNLSAPLTLLPGRSYFAAIAADNTTATFRACASSGGQMSRNADQYITATQVVTSFPLPNPIAIGQTITSLHFCLLFQ